MKHLLVEIKARCHDPAAIRRYLEAQNADFRGIDHQIDTYYKVADGRLKLREGNIERSLIFYQRPNQAGPKDSHVALCKMETIPPGLDHVLSSALGVLQVVDKHREIYFIDNVKFHIDQVNGLGNFMEIEAIGRAGVDEQADLRQQCSFYMEALNVSENDLLEVSYSDLLMQLDA